MDAAAAGVSSEESAELRKLRQLRRANEILKAPAAIFAELDRPQQAS